MAIKADRRNYVISVEFAMQREMEYRQNLEKQGSLGNPLPEFPSSTSSIDPRTAPRPGSSTYLRPIQGLENPGLVPPTRPPLYPLTAEQSRPSPSSGPSRSADQRRKLPSALPSGAFTCQVCQIDCTTGFNLLTHYQGQKHKARLRGVKGKEVVAATTPRPSDKRPYCDLCGIWCVDEHTYRLHFSCPNHILRQYDCLMKRRVYS